MILRLGWKAIIGLRPENAYEYPAEEDVPGSGRFVGLPRKFVLENRFCRLRPSFSR